MKVRLAVLAVAALGVLGFAQSALAHTGSITYGCGKASFNFASFASGSNTVRLYYSIDLAPFVTENRTFVGKSSGQALSVPIPNDGNTHTVVLWATWGNHAGTVNDTTTSDGHSGQATPKVTTQKCPIIGTPVNPNPPVVTVPPVVQSPPSAQRNTILFCVQTSNRGWSTIEAEPDAFTAPNGAWYKLFVSKASVYVAGHVLILTGLEPWEPGNGVVIAPGTNCDGRSPYAGVPVIK